jgi:formate dehydrogenase subunit gamma
MQIASIIHAITSIIWIAFMLGHIYLGSVGVEGVLDGMSSGRVDENWAKQHHSLWYEESRQKGTEASDRGDAQASPARGEPA